MRDDSFLCFVLDQLRGLPGVRGRAMFGGHGLYRDGVFFGIVHRGSLFFKTDDATRPAYVDRGMEPFRPSEAQTLKTYFEVPADVVDDPDELVRWAEAAAGARRDGRR